MLAEHFGRNGLVRVIVRGNEAKTDGTTIYLPENVPAEMHGVLLSTLLHESYHIRLTDFVVGPKLGKDAHRAHVLNVLEDIRIDTQVHKDWPNASNLYWDLLEYYVGAHGAEFNKLPWQVRVLRNLMTRGYRRPAAFDRYLHTDKEVRAFEAKHGPALDSIIDRAKAAPDTATLAPLIDEVLALLFPMDEKAEQERQSNVKAIKDNADKARGARDAQRAAQAKAKDLHKGAVDDENEAHEAEREEVRERGQAAKKRADAKDAKAKGKAQEAKDLDDEADAHEAQADAAKGKAGKAKERRAKAQKELEDLGQEFQAQKKVGDDAQAKVDKANAALQAAREANAKVEAEGLAGAGGIGIGFDKVKVQDLVVKEILPENVEEEVREFLRDNEARKVNAPEGLIDPMRLPTYFDADKLFKREVADAQYKTRIHFLVDISGSMDSPISGDTTRIKKCEAATQAVLDVCRGVDTAIACDGLDVEFGIFGFDTEAHEIKPFSADLDEKAVRSGLAPRGGTDPLEVLRNVEEKHRPDCIRTKQIVFFITDGQFGKDAYDYLEKNTGGHIQWVFIGIDVLDNDPKAVELFGKFNVTQAGDLKRALGKALVERMVA